MRYSERVGAIKIDKECLNAQPSPPAGGRSGGEHRDHRPDGDHLNSMPGERDQKVNPESGRVARLLSTRLNRSLISASPSTALSIRSIQPIQRHVDSQRLRSSSSLLVSPQLPQLVRGRYTSSSAEWQSTYVLLQSAERALS